MNALHTKGPWICLKGEQGNYGDIVITTSARRRGKYVPIAEMKTQFSGGIGLEQESNAWLIAAAPELLAELKAALGVIKECDPETVRMFVPGIRAVIRKAERGTK